MIYFAYGSNMCTGRLRERVPSATPVRIAKLLNHSLRFHKRSDDRSGKCDAYFTGIQEDVVLGVVFEIDPAEKPCLDKHEGLGHGYAEKQITVIDLGGAHHRTFMYAAVETHIDPLLYPYSWYKRFVLKGAVQQGLPNEYIAAIKATPHIEDPRQKSRRDESSHLLLKPRAVAAPTSLAPNHTPSQKPSHLPAQCYADSDSRLGSPSSLSFFALH
ncbi:MAG TPA: gamma-glutamylcyclotransferase family protein [Candidatus Bathyarchaeia archaeon]|nr:gamma-glutamylcyclotransferase family protein [Candidatus Bathyarchaeia archaeon]